MSWSLVSVLKVGRLTWFVDHYAEVSNREMLIAQFPLDLFYASLVGNEDLIYLAMNRISS